MANQEQLDILKQGVVIWNKWREEHPDIIHPDLSKADLKGADLRGANLKGSNLYDADLSKADLRKVNFRDANLHMSQLNGATLTGANFIEADLHFAQMHDANLTRANLRKANLYNVNLVNARIEEAKLFATNLSRAHLEGAHLHGSDLRKAHLHEARLQGADLSEANLSEATLRRIDLRGVKLIKACLSGTELFQANAQKANLQEANLHDADLREANFIEANLVGANLSEANLSDANFSGANLCYVDLTKARLVDTNLMKANLTNCRIFGISAWKIQVEGAIQSNLIITDNDEPTITVDNLEVAQFIYLLLNNPKIRDVIDTIAKKAVLILGRFTPERKAVLDALRDALRTYGYVPILFDFDKPSSRDLTETVSILAHLARFIIADLTEPSSIPKELEAIVPTLAVPVQPLLEGSARPYAMFKDYWKYQWVLKVYRYDGLEELLASLTEQVIEPAERKAKELAKLRAQEIEDRSYTSRKRGTTEPAQDTAFRLNDSQIKRLVDAWLQQSILYVEQAAQVLNIRLETISPSGGRGNLSARATDLVDYVNRQGQ